MYVIGLERERKEEGEKCSQVPEIWKSVWVKEKLVLGEFTR